MTLEQCAGSCVNGKHSWGPQVKQWAGVFRAHYHETCVKCPRIRVIEYTKAGNHIAGYFTKGAAQ